MDERRREKGPRFAQVAADFAKLADALATVPLGDLGPFPAAAELKHAGAALILIPVASGMRARCAISDREIPRFPDAQLRIWGLRSRVPWNDFLKKMPKEKRDACDGQR